MRNTPCFLAHCNGRVGAVGSILCGEGAGEAWHDFTEQTKKKRFKHVQFHVAKNEPRYNNREEIKKSPSL